MGRFSGVASVQTNQGGLYFLDGDYEVEVEETKMVRNRKGIDCFIISATVLKSTNSQRAVGCKPAQVIPMKPDLLPTALGAIKAFAAAVMGIENPDGYKEECKKGEGQDEANDRFWEESLEALVSDEQPAKGTKLHLNVATIKTKAGNDFSKHVWSALK